MRVLSFWAMRVMISSNIVCMQQQKPLHEGPSFAGDAGHDKLLQLHEGLIMHATQACICS